MDSDRVERVRSVVFERLMSGADRGELVEQLRQRFDEATAVRMVDESLQVLAILRRNPDEWAHRKREIKRKISSEYFLWRIVAGIFVVSSLISFLWAVSRNEPSVSLGGVVFGGLILLIVDWRISKKVTAAEEGVDRLLHHSAETG